MPCTELKSTVNYKKQTALPTGIGLDILQDIPAPKWSDQGVLRPGHKDIPLCCESLWQGELFATERLRRNFYMDWFDLYTLYKLLLLYSQE